MPFMHHQRSDDSRQMLIDWSASERHENPLPTLSGQGGKFRRSSRLPVPRPLRTAVTVSVFGQEENGKPVRPSCEEVRAITERYAERMIDMDDEALEAAVKK